MVTVFDGSRLSRADLNIPLSVKGKYHTLNTLKTMLKSAEEDGALKRLPVFPRLPQATESDIEYISFEEQQGVIGAIPERHRAVYEFGMEFGLRMGELRAVKKDCIGEHELIVKRSFSQNELMETTKTKRIRRLPLTERTLEIINRTPPSFSDFVFTYDGQKPYTERQLRRIWKAACEKVGIKIHAKNAIRHSMGCQLLDEGVDLEMVRDLYGHTSTNTTRHHVHRSPARMKEALELRGRVIDIKKAKEEVR